MNICTYNQATKKFCSIQSPCLGSINLPTRLLLEIADQTLDVKNQYLGIEHGFYYSRIGDVFIILGFTITNLLGAPP